MAEVTSNRDINTKLCDKKDLEGIKKFYSNITDTSELQYLMNEALQRVSYEGNIDMMRYFLNNTDFPLQADIHYEDDVALSVACFYNRFDAVKFLLTSPDLKEHANINADGKPLCYAAEAGHLKIVKYLLHSDDLKIHADINHISKLDTHIFHQCLNQSQLEVLQYLIKEPSFNLELALSHIDGDNMNVFAVACTNCEKDTDIVDFLLLDCNYKIKPEDEKYMKENMSSELVQRAQKLYNIKISHENLDNKLSYKEQKYKGNKNGGKI